MPSLTRRQSMAALVSGGVVTALAGVSLFAGEEEKLIGSIIHRVVGSYRMNEEQFTTFVADLDTKKGSAAHAKFALYRAFAATEPDTLLRFAPTGMRDNYNSYERRVVTNFLTRTDYLSVGAEREASFSGEAACRNPFAKFDTI